MKIYRLIEEVETLMNDLSVDDQTELKQAVSGEDIIISRFAREGSQLDIQIGDYIRFNDATYYILAEPGIKKAKNTYTYSLFFKSDLYMFQNVIAINPETEETEFYLFGDAVDMVSLVLENMNRVYNPLGTGSLYYADYVELTDAKNIAFRDENCLQALQKLAKEFSCEFVIEGKKLTFREQIGVKRDIIFEYEKNLQEIERKTVSDSELVTVLYPKGSERNLTWNYGKKRLSIPAISKNTEIFGTIERTVNFDEVYPRYKGSVSRYESNNIFFDEGIDFDLNLFLMAGKKARVVFQSGDVSGREFEIASYNHALKKIDLIPYEDIGQLFPNDDLKPRVGDKYVFIDIRMPQTYIDNAEADLAIKAQEYIDKYSQPNVTYTVKPHYPELRRKNQVLKLGDIVTVKDLDFGIEFESRILSLTRKIASPFEYTLEIGNKLTINYVVQVLNDSRNIRNEIYYTNQYFNDLYDRLYNNITDIAVPFFVNMGAFDPDTYYYNNKNRRDYIYLTDEAGNKTWYMFVGEDHSRGAFIEANWQLIGNQFDIIATQTILAENANIGNWLIQAGQIVSQSVYESDDENEIEPTAQLNGVYGFIRLVAKIAIEGAAGIRDYKQTIMIDSRNAEIRFEREGDAFQEPALAIASAGGFSSDFPNTEFREQITTDTNFLTYKGLGSFVSNARTKMPYFSGYGFIAAFIGRIKNLNTGFGLPSFGGVFFGLKTYGHFINIRVLNGSKAPESYNMYETDDLVVGENSVPIVVNLPKPGETFAGREIFVRRNKSDLWVAGNIYTNKYVTIVGINHGDKWSFVFDGAKWMANYQGRSS